jgi:hypothetical protein
LLKAKRIIDHCRVLSLRSLGFAAVEQKPFTHCDVTLENWAIVAAKGD